MNPVLPIFRSKLLVWPAVSTGGCERFQIFLQSQGDHTQSILAAVGQNSARDEQGSLCWIYNRLWWCQYQCADLPYMRLHTRWQCQKPNYNCSSTKLRKIQVHTGRASRSWWNDDERLRDNVLDFCRPLKTAGLEFARSNSPSLRSGCSSIRNPSASQDGQIVLLKSSCKV